MKKTMFVVTKTIYHFILLGMLTRTVVSFCTSSQDMTRTSVFSNHGRNALYSVRFHNRDEKSVLQISDASFSHLNTESFIRSRDSAVFKHSQPSDKLATFLAFVVIGLSGLMGPASADLGASDPANAKIQKGGASTLQSGRTISITRGVNLDRSDFQGQNLKGVAFQQSIVRDTNFKGSNLIGASFFDATLDGSDFEGADMTLANIEMAQLDRVNLKNAVVREMFVSGSTILEGVKSIEGSDWTDTQLRKDQQKFLCNHPTAKGTNPTTGVDTRESLMCID